MSERPSVAPVNAMPHGPPSMASIPEAVPRKSPVLCASVFMPEADTLELARRRVCAAASAALLDVACACAALTACVERESLFSAMASLVDTASAA